MSQIGNNLKATRQIAWAMVLARSIMKLTNSKPKNLLQIQQQFIEMQRDRDTAIAHLAEAKSQIGSIQRQKAQAEAKSGCCSWHGGVCGCDSQTGHDLCCDGSDSPSCGC